MRSTILSTRGVDQALLGPGIVDGSDGEFMKSFASEDAVILKVGLEGGSLMLNVHIVEDGCILLGSALAKDLFSDELEYKSFLFSDLACWLCFIAASFDFCANVVALLLSFFCFCLSGWA